MLMTYEGIYPQFSGCVLRTCLQKRIRRTHTQRPLPEDLMNSLLEGEFSDRDTVLGYDDTGVWCCVSLCVRPCSCFLRVIKCKRESFLV